MRLIDSDALKEALKRNLPQYLWGEMFVTVNVQPTIDAVSEWIPCSERLPKSHGYYICTCKDGSKYKRTTAVKWSNGWQLTGARAYWIVLAWMPLPEPWEGADDE